MYFHRLFEAMAISEKDALEAGLLFAETEGILPAPESAYAIAAAIRLAQKQDHKPLTILVNVSGHGLYDLSAYDAYKKGILKNSKPNEEVIKKSLLFLQKNDSKIQQHITNNQLRRK